MDSVQTLLDQGCDVDSLDEDENTPVQVASANGHENVVRLLIMRGAGLDKRNVFGWTPLLQVGASRAARDKQAVIIDRSPFSVSGACLRDLFPWCLV